MVFFFAHYIFSVMPLFKVIINNRPKAKLVNICVCSDLSYQWKEKPSRILGFNSIDTRIHEEFYWSNLLVCMYFTCLTFLAIFSILEYSFRPSFKITLLIIVIPSTIWCISREEKLVKGKKIYCCVLFLTSPLKKVQKSIFQRIEPSTRYSKVH